MTNKIPWKNIVNKLINEAKQKGENINLQEIQKKAKSQYLKMKKSNQKFPSQKVNKNNNKKHKSIKKGGLGTCEALALQASGDTGPIPSSKPSTQDCAKVEDLIEKQTKKIDDLDATVEKLLQQLPSSSGVGPQSNQPTPGQGSPSKPATPTPAPTTAPGALTPGADSGTISSTLESEINNLPEITNLLTLLEKILTLVEPDQFQQINESKLLQEFNDNAYKAIIKNIQDFKNPEDDASKSLSEIKTNFSKIKETLIKENQDLLTKLKNMVAEILDTKSQSGGAPDVKNEALKYEIIALNTKLQELKKSLEPPIDTLPNIKKLIVAIKDIITTIVTNSENKYLEPVKTQIESLTSSSNAQKVETIIKNLTKTLPIISLIEQLNQIKEVLGRRGGTRDRAEKFKKIQTSIKLILKNNKDVGVNELITEIESLKLSTEPEEVKDIIENLETQVKTAFGDGAPAAADSNASDAASGAPSERSGEEGKGAAGAEEGKGAGGAEGALPGQADASPPNATDGPPVGSTLAECNILKPNISEQIVNDISNCVSKDPVEAAKAKKDLKDYFQIGEMGNAIYTNTEDRDRCFTQNQNQPEKLEQLKTLQDRFGEKCKPTYDSLKAFVQFAVILCESDISGATDCSAVAVKLEDALKEPFKNQDFLNGIKNKLDMVNKETAPATAPATAATAAAPAITTPFDKTQGGGGGNKTRKKRKQKLNKNNKKRFSKLYSRYKSKKSKKCKTNKKNKNKKRVRRSRKLRRN